MVLWIWQFKIGMLYFEKLHFLFYNCFNKLIFLSLFIKINWFKLGYFLYNWYNSIQH